MSAQVVFWILSFSTTVALAILVWSIVPGWVKARASTQVGCPEMDSEKAQLSFKVRKNLWRPKVKLLTEDEYREQSNIETRKALEELRRYLILMENEEMALNLNI